MGGSQRSQDKAYGKCSLFSQNFASRPVLVSGGPGREIRVASRLSFWLSTPGYTVQLWGYVECYLQVSP